jgi:hypothetical protein
VYQSLTSLPLQALFGWIGINTGAINRGIPTLASIDLGGSSLEVAFQVAAPHAAPTLDTVAVTVADQYFQLYARSFRQAGANDLRGRRLRNVTTGLDVCLATGYVTNYTVDGLIRPFIGASSHDGCQTAIVTALGVADPCLQASNTTRCTLYGQTMPNVPKQRTLNVHSGFYYTISDFGLETPVTVMAVSERAEVSQPNVSCSPGP